MDKNDIIEVLTAEIQHIKDDYYGKDPHPNKIIEGLNYRWKHHQTYKEWKRTVIAVLDDCMRLGASLGSWTRLDSKPANRAARVAFDTVQEEMFYEITRAVHNQHDDELPEEKHEKH